MKSNTTIHRPEYLAWLVIGLGLQHQEVKIDLHQSDSGMVSCVSTHEEGQPIFACNFDDAQDLTSLFDEPQIAATTFHGGKPCIHEPFGFAE